MMYISFVILYNLILSLFDESIKSIIHNWFLRFINIFDLESTKNLEFKFEFVFV